MRKILCTAALLLAGTLGAKAQMLTTQELEKYAQKQYGETWVKAAKRLEKDFTIDANGALTCQQVIETPGKSRDRLYMLLNYWFTSTLNTSDYILRLSDKEAGRIIAQGHVRNIAENTGVFNRYFVSIAPIIKCDIKEERIRVTCSIPFLEVVRMEGGQRPTKDSPGIPPKRHDEQWPMESCYPLYKKDQHKRTSSKAMVMSLAYTRVLMDRIARCVRNAQTDKEDDNW